MSVTEIKKSSAPKETGSGMERFNAIKPGTNVAYTTLFILLAILCVIPVIFVIIISFSSEASIGKVGYSFVPAEWSTSAYDYVWHLRNTRGVPTVVMAVTPSWPNSLRMRVAWWLTASMDRSSGVFLSRASPP